MKKKKTKKKKWLNKLVHCNTELK